MEWPGEILRPTSITDQIFIKANRIRSIEEKRGLQKSTKGLSLNLSVSSLLHHGADSAGIMTGRRYPDRISNGSPNCMRTIFKKAKALMLDKHHDYGEAWRSMRISSYTDLILMKINRTESRSKIIG